MPDFANRLKQMRTEQKISQKELAKHLNVSQNAVFNWENRKREPSIETILTIANYFDVTPAYVMGWEDEIESLCGMTTFLDEIDDYLQELGEFLYYHPDHKVLFEASMAVDTKDISLAKKILDKISGAETSEYTEKEEP